MSQHTECRREFIKKAAFGMAGLTLSRRWVVPNDKTRPNIIFIMTDQQQAGMMSGTGNPYLKTPALDRLAASGMRFERAYATNPVCVPSRFSLMTGRMPSCVGIRKNPSKPDSYIDSLPMLGNLLRAAGYETVYGGKIHLPMRFKHTGFDLLTYNARQELADACVQFLKQPHSRPFMLFASFINPHDICYMPINDYLLAFNEKPYSNVDANTLEALIDEPRKNLDEFVRAQCPPLPDNFEIPRLEPECITEKYTLDLSFRQWARVHWSPEIWRLFRWAYCRLTEMVDEKIGQVLDAVRESGLEDNTLIVFTSDHGEMNAAHRLEHKSVLYEEAVRIPFIISYKGMIPAGTVDDSHFVSNGLDLLPTLCDYAGIRPPGDLLGRSIRPVAEGKNTAPWRASIALESQDGRMVRTGRYKYCVYNSGAHREQLTDLEQDPGEMNNLAYDPDYAEELRRHRMLLKEWLAVNRDRFASEYIIEDSAEEQEKGDKV